MQFDSKQTNDESTSVTEKLIPTWRAAGLRYYAYRHFLHQRFGGKKVFRVSVDAGFTCPNVDGTLAVGGCVYCDNESFSPTRRLPRVPIAKQLEQGMAALKQRYQPEAFLAYLQPATNTYGKLEKLKRVYDEALNHPDILGMIIGTRPDCVGEDVLDLVNEYAERCFVSLELGLQTVHQRSLDWMNRADTPESYFDAVIRLKRRPKIDVCAHIILGLPGESREDMLASVTAVGASGINGVKLHNLHVIADTPLEEQYKKGEVSLLSRADYLDLLIECLEILPEHMVIHRLTGDAPDNYLVAPPWVKQKANFLQELDAEMTRRNTWQGRKSSA